MRTSSRIASERRGELARVDELHRPARARVAARGAGLVLAQAPLGVGRPAAVERAVGAAQEVDERGHEGELTAPLGCLLAPAKREPLRCDR